MAYYFATVIAIFIFALGLEATALNEQNGNMRDGRFLTKREAPPNPLDSTDIQSLKKILAFVESAVDRNTQQVLASTNQLEAYMQGPRRYDEAMTENREMKQTESKFYDALKAFVASGRPGRGGRGYIGAGR